MKSNLCKYSTGVLCVICFAACDIINPPETIPSTIKLNPVVLEVQPGQGSAKHKITEVWIYGNSNLLGAFTPPVNVYHTTDSAVTDFSFRPGIRNNGILDDAIIYPLYTAYELEINTTPGTITEVTPVVRYLPNARFSLFSDFEMQNDFVDNRDTVPASVLTRSSVDPFEGEFSGEIILDSAAHFIEVSHLIPLTDLPSDANKPVYLELHYKAEVEMSIGLLGIPLNGEEYTNIIYLVKPNENWNKLYIELTDILAASGLPAYKILFRSLYPPGATKSSYKIQLDNITVVYLQ